MLAQTVPDGVRALVQVGGSPSDCAGRRPTYRIRMACKRSAVRARLAPLHGISAAQSLSELGLAMGRWPTSAPPLTLARLLLQVTGSGWLG